MEIKDADELRSLLVGRTIVAADREPDSPGEWNLGENTVTLTLDNGATVEFEGIGYDASSCVATYAEAS